MKINNIEYVRSFYPINCVPCVFYPDCGEIPRELLGNCVIYIRLDTLKISLQKEKYEV